MQIEIQVTEEMIRHSRIRDLIYLAGFVYGVAILLFVLRSGLSAKLRDLAERISRRCFVRAAVYIALLIVVVSVLQFPLTYYAGFVVPHQFGLSNQTFSQWFLESLQGLGVAVLIGSLAGAPAVVAMQRIRRWWLPLWLGSIPAIVLLVIIAPVLLDPIFNRFEPLRDQDLKEELLDLASRAGIEGGRVFQVDKSKQTTTMNAYVTGIGPTKRIVMWDTLLQKMTREEVVSVMGHEMGHYVLHHVWKGVALAVAGVLAALLVAHAVYARARIDARDMATFPWLLVILTVLLFLGSPVAAGFSRHLEHEADVFALDLTGLGVPMATAFVKLAEDTKINPDPHPVIEFWRYSHPSLKKRVEFALSAGRRAGGVGPYRSR